MPNRLGLLHVRDAVTESVQVSQADIDQALELREDRLRSVSEKTSELEHEQAVKLGIYFAIQ